MLSGLMNLVSFTVVLHADLALRLSPNAYLPCRLFLAKNLPMDWLRLSPPVQTMWTKLLTVWAFFQLKR